MNGEEEYGAGLFRKSILPSMWCTGWCTAIYAANLLYKYELSDKIVYIKQCASAVKIFGMQASKKREDRKYA